MSEQGVPQDTPGEGTAVRWLGFGVGLAAVLCAAFAIADGLRFDPVQDEQHFLDTSQLLARELPDSPGALRSYQEVITPLAFVFWGFLDRWTGDGVFLGRLCNLLLVGAIVCLIAVRRGAPSREGVLAGIGVLGFPYLLGLGVHLYTDVPASFLALSGLWLWLRGRSVAGALLFCAAIATRQYLVAVPVAVAAWEWHRALRGEADRWVRGGLAALAALSLAGWFLFFGGLAPPSGIERWLTKYPAPMREAGQFIVPYGLYFLTSLACYIVLPELVLFRRRVDWRTLASRRSAVFALLLAALFVAAPPAFDEWNGGVVDRIWQFLLPPGAVTTPLRVGIYFALALITCLRFGQRIDLAACLVGVHFVLLMKSQLPWDKYFMPAIVLLWFLKAEGRLEGAPLAPAGGSPERGGARAAPDGPATPR